MQKANMAYVSHRSKYRYSGRSLNTVILEHNVVGVFWPKKTNQTNTEQKKHLKTQNVQKTPEAVAGFSEAVRGLHC